MASQATRTPCLRRVDSVVWSALLGILWAAWRPCGTWANPRCPCRPWILGGSALHRRQGAAVCLGGAGGARERPAGEVGGERLRHQVAAHAGHYDPPAAAGAASGGSSLRSTHALYGAHDPDGHAQRADHAGAAGCGRFAEASGQDECLEMHLESRV